MDRRTALISAASVVGVVLAGATAVAANVGILDRADSSGVGELSASADAPTLEPQIIDVQFGPENPSATVVQLDAGDAGGLSDPTGESAGQPFIVADAGVVAIETAADGLSVVDVTPNDGWTYLEADASDGTVSVVFDSATATYVFTATLEGDGSITAAVEQPIIEFVTRPSPSSPSMSDDDFDDHDDDFDDHDDDDDDDRDDDDRDDDDDDRDDDDDDHEGRDDDD